MAAYGGNPGDRVMALTRRLQHGSVVLDAMRVRSTLGDSSSNMSSDSTSSSASFSAGFWMAQSLPSRVGDFVLSLCTICFGFLHPPTRRPAAHRRSLLLRFPLPSLSTLPAIFSFFLVSVVHTLPVDGFPFLCALCGRGRNPSRSLLPQGTSR